MTRPTTPAPIRIDIENEWAWCGERRLDLAPRVFALLRHFVEHPGRLITKNDLFAALWGDTVVGEAALTSCVRDLRRALEDSSQTPRYVETVHRRGFRFIGPVATGRVAPPIPTPGPPAPSTPPPRVPFVGRDAELVRLRTLFAAAASGQRRLVFVTGEPGIGKTALVDEFLAAIGDGEALRVARGQCVEQYGIGEPYLPVLEALGRLGRDAHGPDIVPVLKRWAPTWLAQLPALMTDEELEAVRRRAQGATRERMLREVIEALEAVSADVPLIMVLEDLHWADSATIELLAMLARRADTARLLILATYRPSDVEAGTHPLKPVKEELEMHGRCAELALEFLGEAAVAEYLLRRFPGAAFPSGFARGLHEGTRGNPLFLVNVIADLLSQGHLREVDGGWKLTVPVDRAVSGVPRTLWQLVEKHVERLTEREQAVLAVASVAGAECSAALALADGIDVREAEECCARLARRSQFLRPLGVAEWADGTIAGRYGFIHAMYRTVLYARIPISHRVGLHLRIGTCLERAYGSQAGEFAAELAMHFEQGRDFDRAVRYRRLAADTALRQHGYREAVDHATRALVLIASLPESPERDRQELLIQTALGAAVIATSGWAAPDVARAYARARDLCPQTGVTPQLFPVLLGLNGFYLMRGQLDIAHEMSERLGVLARETDDAAVRLAANNTAGLELFYRGEFVAALARFEQATKIYDPEQHSPNRLRGFSVDHDPGVSCAAHTALTLMMLGYQDRAAVRMRECLGYARAIDHPLSLAMAYNFAATFYQYRREHAVLREIEDVRLEYATKYDFDLFLLLGEIYRGWLLAEQGQPEDGAEQIHRGLAVYQAIGAELGRPTFLAMLAEVCDGLGRREEGLSTLAEAMELADRTGLHYWDAELRRLKGTLVLHAGTSPRHAGRGRRGRSTAEDDAEALFLEAIDIARRQQARAFELRAAMSLGRLHQRQGRSREGRAILAETYRWFTEGFEMPDLIDARALLEELGGRPR